LGGPNAVCLALLEHDHSGQVRGQAFPKTGIHFSGSCLQECEKQNDIARPAHRTAQSRLEPGERKAPAPRPNQRAHVELSKSVAMTPVACRPSTPPGAIEFSLGDTAAGETLPEWRGKPATAHWRYPDPIKAEGTELERRRAFVRIVTGLERQL